MPKFDDVALDDIFTYHAPTADDLVKYQNIREAGKVFARVIRDNTPESPDQSVAIRGIREVVMAANAAVALRGKF